MKLKNIIAFSLWTIVMFVCYACSQENENVQPNQSLRFELFDAGTVTRAATDGAMTTNFELADKAGLYVVKNGQVLIENRVLTYNANGFWESTEAIEASEELSGAQFYAYYPYTSDAVFNVADSNPFAQMIASRTVGTKQNTKAEYEEADLMVSTATALGQYNAVRIPLLHQKALVCVELPNASYIFDNANMDPYVVSKAENAVFTLGETTVQPYFDNASQSYRLIVEPGHAASLKVSFTNSGKQLSYETPVLADIAAGQYAKFVINGGASLVKMTLKVGDFYCADGKIISGDTPQADLPNNIVGVVFKIGTTESIRSANSNWCHAVVIGLNETRGKWGTNASTTSAQNAAGWRYWYKNFGLADQSGITKAASLNETNMAEEGFEVTIAWCIVPEPLTIGDYTLDYTSGMNSMLNTQIADHILPSNICSGWYYPSLGDWQNIESQLSVLSTQLTLAGGTDIRWNDGKSDNYWSCNVRAAGSNWCYVGNKSSLADRYKGVGCSSNAYVRFLLAF